MVDKETTQNRIAGLRENRKKLRENEKLFLKAVGLDESAEKSLQEAAAHEKDIEDIKVKLAALKAEKEAALSPTLIAIKDVLTSLLPEGEGMISIDDDGSMTIGWWMAENTFRPYEGLSGGETVIFDQALSSALLKNVENKILKYEAAEIDPPHLRVLLEKLLKIDAQIIVNTWFDPEEIPDGWKVVYLNGE